MNMKIMLRALVVASMALTISAQALDRTIKVTTFQDEDGTNASRCSLREAVHAVNKEAAYGGCPAGSGIYDNLIQLQPGTYTLSSEISVEAEMTIAGADTMRPDEKSPMTGRTPNRVRPDDATSGTYIEAANGQRIFNATAGLSIRDVVLSGSGSPLNGNGGLVYTSNNLAVENSILEGGIVSGATASAGNGGAVYLARNESGLTLTDVTLRNNQASNKGGAIAMSCRVDLVSYASHSVSISRSLIEGNSATLGAGAIEVCGQSNLSIGESTLSQNSTSAAGAGAISFIQATPDLGIGRLSLNYVTAVRQQGHVISASGLSSIEIGSSILGFTTDGARICFPDQTAVATSAPSGRYNVFGDDSCEGNYEPASQNTILPLGVTIDDVLVPIAQGTHGLTNYYLPLPNPPTDYLIDQGDVLGACNSKDQRNVKRSSGDLCDIGAVELLQMSATDDEAESLMLTDRLAAVDILENDFFAETAAGPIGFEVNSSAEPAVIATAVTADTTCDWRPNDDPDYPDLLVVSHNSGQATDPDSPLECSYVLIDKATGAPPTDPVILARSTGTVTVKIMNQNPLARPDTYVRPEGSSSVTFDPLENDDDDGDGKYGRVDSNDPKSEPAWEKFYPIEIMDQPQLGTVIGSGAAPSGLCPGSASEPRICLAPPLKYTTDNNLSPFADTFTYRVYDAEGKPSNSAAITIATDVPEPGTGGGSLDLFGGLLLALLGLRRFLKL
jgi:CSLREA domain-containing protein